MKNKDASKSLPRRSATACAAWSEETAPLCSSRTVNELQHATRWRPSMIGHCKRGLSQLDHSESNWNKRPLGQSLALGWFYSPRAIKPSLGSRLSRGTFISVRSLFRWSNYYLAVTKPLLLTRKLWQVIVHWVLPTREHVSSVDSEIQTWLPCFYKTTTLLVMRDRKPHLIGWSMRITLDVTWRLHFRIFSAFRVLCSPCFK